VQFTLGGIDVRKLTLVVAALLLIVGSVAIAYASIPGPDGVIHGCYKTSNPAQGAVIVIDHTASCPSGYTALNWNQTGPQGPAGPAGLSGVHVIEDTTSVSDQVITVLCPSGETAISASAALFNGVGGTFNAGGFYAFHPTLDGNGKPVGYEFIWWDSGSVPRRQFVTCATTA
jgi:hypothetical protein